MKLGPFEFSPKIDAGALLVIALAGVGWISTIQEVKDHIANLDGAIARIEHALTENAAALRDVRDEARVAIQAESERRERDNADRIEQMNRMQRMLDDLVQRRKTERDPEPPERRG